MKKILSILGTITLIATSTTSLIACNTPEYTQEKLAKLKEENKININGNTLEWIVPQERPFHQVDNKWYFVIWRSHKSVGLKIVKFKNSIDTLKKHELYIDKNDQLEVHKGRLYYTGLVTTYIDDEGRKYPYTWGHDRGHFKAVYRWDGEGEPKKLIIDPKTGKIIDQKKDK